MRFSSTDRQFHDWWAAVNKDEDATLSREAVTQKMQSLRDKERVINAEVASLAAKAISMNQQNVDGAKSGAAWWADQFGVSEPEARAQLATQKAISDSPDLKQAVQRGEVSLSQASIIGKGDSRPLLDAARNGASVEDLKRQIQHQQAQINDRDRLRQSQYIHIGKPNADTMVFGKFWMLAENVVPFLDADRKARGDTPYERAESFMANLSAGATKTKVVFHMNIDSDGNLLDAFLKGAGPVNLESAIAQFEKASFALVGTYQNKLEFYNEEQRKSKTAPVPEWVKRIVREAGYDTCAADHCGAVAEDVDHILARTNGGDNQLFNLQPLCPPDHDAKTKKDAPWTAGGIYGKQARDSAWRAPPHRDTS